MTIRLAIQGASFLLMLSATAMVFLWVPTDAVLGISQRIFYLHVPLAWVGFLAFGIVFGSSILFLWRGTQRWDELAHASAEIGIIFMSLLLVTGVLWAKVSWQVWWTWSPQLTTSLILWLIYVAYLMLRSYGPIGQQGARYAAVLGIIGFVDVPIVYMAAQWWRDVHPEAVIGPLAEEGSLETSMYVTFLVSLISFTVLYTVILIERLALHSHKRTSDELRRQYGL
jgi:heme exporter protein C